MSLNPATQGSEYLLTHRSWTSRMGTGLRKWSFSRPRRRVTTSPASSSTFRCFMTPKRDMENRSSNMPRVWPSSVEQLVEQAAPGGVGQGLEHLVHPWHIM